MNAMISEDMLVAYTDGELDEVSRRRVERALADDPALAARLAGHRRLAAALAAEYAPLAQEAAPDRFRALIEGAAKVAPIAPARRSIRWVPVAIAASLVLGLFIGRGLDGPGGPVGVKDGQLVAQGRLAKALDNQLASTQSAEAAVRIGLSFRAKDGHWCRSFDGEDVSGVACHGGAGWHLEQAVPGRVASTAYRQASSADPRILATVEALMAQSPADAAGEKVARAEGWAR